MPRALMENLSPADLDHILLHELAHLARFDDWTNLTARVMAAVFGVHPVAAWILKRIDREREIACDDWVVDMTGAARPYAASLARLVEFRLSRRKEMLATGIGGPKSELASRIERLVKGSGRFDPRTSLLRVNVTVAALALVVFAAAAQGPHWIAFAQDDVPVPPTPAMPQVPPMPRTPAVAPVPAVRSVKAVPPVLWAPPAPPAPVIADVEEIAAPSEFAYAVPSSADSSFAIGAGAAASAISAFLLPPKRAHLVAPSCQRLQRRGMRICQPMKSSS